MPPVYRSRLILTLAAILAVAATLLSWQWQRLHDEALHRLKRDTYKHALSLMDKASWDDALVELHAAMRLDPMLADAYFYSAGIYWTKEDYKMVIFNYSAFLRLEPGGKIDSPGITALYFRGLSYSKLGHYEKALADFDKLISLEPKNYKLHAARADVYASQGELEKALADYNISLDFKSSETLTHRGELYVRMHDRDKALADFDAAIEHDSTETMAIKDRLELLASTSESSNSDPLKESQHANEYAWFLATNQDKTFRNGTLAVQYAIKACDASNWTNPTYIGTLAAAHAEAGDFGNAVKFESWAISMAPDMKEARSRLGLYQARKAYHEAVDVPGS